MHIVRTGHNRVERIDLIASPKPIQEIRFRSEGEVLFVAVTLHGTTDPQKAGQYNHTVHLTIDDIKAVLNTLARDGAKAFEAELAASLADAAPQLLRLLVLANGFSTRPPVTRAQAATEDANARRRFADKAMAAVMAEARAVVKKDAESADDGEEGKNGLM